MIELFSREALLPGGLSTYSSSPCGGIASRGCKRSITVSSVGLSLVARRGCIARIATSTQNAIYNDNPTQSLKIAVLSESRLERKKIVALYDHTFWIVILTTMLDIVHLMI